MKSLLCLVVAFTVCVARADSPDDPAVVANFLAMKLVRIPAGEFQMGSHESSAELLRVFAKYHPDPADLRDELPRHRVRITRPFYLGQYEVTVGQFRSFVQDASYRTDAERDGEGGWGYDPALRRCVGRRPEFDWRKTGFAQTEDHPVVNVSWDDAHAFCQWLSRREGHRYRLPTEAEWEYACRAGTTTRYQSGDDPSGVAQFGRLIDTQIWREFRDVQDLDISPGDRRAFTVPVGRYRPNRFGLYDMHGNVWEWCADWHVADLYARSPVADPLGSDDTQGVRVRRGGAWNSFPVFCRSSFRNWSRPDSRCINHGFRVLREASVTATSSERPGK